MATKNSTSKYRQALENKARRIIRATGFYPKTLRNLVRDTMENEPRNLGKLIKWCEAQEAEWQKMREDANAFTLKAYTVALDFFYKHRGDKEALNKFLFILEESTR